MPIPIDIPRVLHAVLDEYALTPSGFHGVTHWARVLENGLRVAEHSGADTDVVRLFAVLHDSKRESDGHDPDHGQRGADFAAELRGRVFDLDDDRFDLLYQACAGHTHERTHADITVQACFDADRLDLGRVGITPLPERLCTEFARRKETINWADGRARFQFVPDFVETEWEIMV